MRDNIDVGSVFRTKANANNFHRRAVTGARSAERTLEAQMRFHLIAVFILTTTSTFGQVGKNTELWEWSKPARHHNAVVKVQIEEPGTPGPHASASGVVVKFDRLSELPAGEAYCLTAAHVLESVLPKTDKKSEQADGKNQSSGKDDNYEPIVVKPKEQISVLYRTGEVSRRCQIVAVDEKRDVALLRVAIPKSTKPARIATESIKHGELLEFTGFGGGSSIKAPRHFNSQASAPTTPDLIYADTTLLPGDSGGAVFNEKREVVGVISGGWIWWQGGVQGPVGQTVPTTWPARACNVGPIRQLRPRKAKRRSRRR